MTDIPEINFANFVASFAATGAMAIQQVEQSMSSAGEAAGNDALGSTQALATVQHLIDTLGMLQTKTSGNLDDDETQSLDSALTDLKFAYVRIQQRVVPCGLTGRRHGLLDLLNRHSAGRREACHEVGEVDFGDVDHHNVSYLVEAFLEFR